MAFKSRRASSPPTPDPDTPDDAYTHALSLLGAREHAPLEIHHKLMQRGFSHEISEATVARLVQEGWLDAARYAELYAASRADRGYGPLRIARELRERGLDPVLIDQTLSALSDGWLTRLADVYHKRWGMPPRDVHEKAKRLRFLRQRGFSIEQIQRLWRTLNDSHADL